MQYRELWTTCPFPQHCTGSLTCSAAVLLRTVQVIRVPSLATQNLDNPSESSFKNFPRPGSSHRPLPWSRGGEQTTTTTVTNH